MSLVKKTISLMYSIKFSSSCTVIQYRPQPSKQKETKKPKNKNTLKADWVNFVWFMRVLKSLRKKDEVEPKQTRKNVQYWNFVWDYLGWDLLILSRSRHHQKLNKQSNWSNTSVKSLPNHPNLKMIPKHKPQICFWKIIFWYKSCVCEMIC